MTDIKRYDIFLDGFERFWDYEEVKDGDWIKASDHDKAMAEKDKRIAELESENEDLQLEALIAWADGVQGDLGTENANKVQKVEIDLSIAILSVAKKLRHSTLAYKRGEV